MPEHKQTVEQIFNSHTGNIIHKWHHYLEIYDRHFEKFVGKEITILEIGVYKGGSLEMWRNYFGNKCKIVGIDINPMCKRFENDYTKIFIGSQSDRDFLKKVKTEVPKFDIIIDDGGHMMDHLRISFEELYDSVSEDGIYLAEDLHTCYWYQYGGGYKRKKSFIEYSKNLVDKLHAWHSFQKKLTVTPFTESTYAIHFYDSIAVFEKRKIKKPYHLYSGKEDEKDIESIPPESSGLWRKLFRKIYYKTGIDFGFFIK